MKPAGALAEDGPGGPARRDGGSILSLGDDRGRSFRRFAGAGRQAQQSQRGRRGDKNFLHGKPLPLTSVAPAKTLLTAPPAH
jgi:hypothetical protein